MAEGLAHDVPLRSRQGRWVVAATVLGSGMASLDATVVNVALPRIGRALHTGFSGLQWTINAYTLTLAAFLLVGGALGDRLGRRRTFVIGTIGFGAASLACALAPNAGALIAFRALEGVFAALLTPSSLAILQASFLPDDRGAAIGAWSGLSGVAAAAGPLLGGWLVEVWSWRLVFIINLPIAAAVVAVALRHVPETIDDSAPPIDLTGAALVAAGLAAVTWALTEGPPHGWPIAEVGAVIAGVALLVAFVVVEFRSSHPLVSHGLFRSRVFAATNLLTMVVYGAIAGTFFLLPLELQRSLRYSPVAAGLSLLPITLVMLALSARAGRVAARTGPRLPLTVGPLVASAGLLLLVRVRPGQGYVSTVLPAVLLFSLGLAATVAPLTAAVLGAVEDRHAGVASAVNSDVARTAGLLAVAAIPAAAGIRAADYNIPARFTSDFHTAVVLAAGLCAAGGVLAAATLGPGRKRGGAAVAAAAGGGFHCAITGPPVLDVAVAGSSPES